MASNEEDILASINKLRLLAFELIEKVEKLRKDSKNFSLDNKVEAMRQIVEWAAEDEALNIRASELALQMVDDTKTPIKHKPRSFMGSFLFVFFLRFLELLLQFFIYVGDEAQEFI